MAAARNQFQGFLDWMTENAYYIGNSDLLRLLQLIVTEFDEVAARGTQNSRRSAYLHSLWRNRLETTQPELPVIDAGAGEPQLREWTALSSLQIGPFRGFRFEEHIDFPTRITLVSGMNGTGKTSFCQAMELGLLGYVEEAELSRLEQESYLRNFFANNYAAPVLLATDGRRRDIEVRPDAAAFGFAFVEKNRIETFARIATRTPRAKEGLIASLFGIEPLTEFLNGFNVSIDGVCTITPVLANALELRRQAIAQDIATVAARGEIRDRSRDEYDRIAREYREDLDYPGLLNLLGTEDRPGRLAELERLASAAPPPISGVTANGMIAGLQQVRASQAWYASARNVLAARAGEVSFRDMYQAISELDHPATVACPACDTPLQDVTTNPFAKARAGLERLGDLADLEEQVNLAFRQLAQQNGDFGDALRRLVAAVSPLDGSETRVADAVTAGIAEPHERAWIEIDREVPDQPSVWDLVMGLCVTAEIGDETNRNVAEQLGAYQSELRALQSTSANLRQQDGVAQERDAAIARAQARIDEFNIANEELAGGVAAERESIAVDARLRTAYGSLMRLLEQYRFELPGRLMAGLQDLARDLYNDFNRLDQEGDKLASLLLPVNAEGRITLAFRHTPDTDVDALHMLSEGHIKCLGLAILMAKNLQTSCPIVIFDDAVNAIDSDHRSGLLQTIFGEENRFQGKQVFVTCHNPEFITQAQQHLPGNADLQSTLVLFGPHRGDSHPVLRVRPSRKYLDAARRFLEEQDPRLCLANCRFAIQDVGYRLWRWTDELGHGLRLELRTPTSEPFLRDLFDQLLTTIDDRGFAAPNKAAIVVVLRELLAQPRDGFIWSYLNLGAHPAEYGNDFDWPIVRQTLDTTARLETEFRARNRQPN